MSHWLDRCAWRRRSREFGELGGEPLTMEFGDLPDELWQVWWSRPAHPGVLTAVTWGHLMYAAIDWARETTDDVDTLVSWGVDLCRAYEGVHRSLSAEWRWWLTAPLVKIDLDGHARLAFLDPNDDLDRLPPECREWRACDERGLVYVVGHSLRALAPEVTAADVVIDRCLAADPRARFATLDEVHWALASVIHPRLPPAWRGIDDAWRRFEAGVGFLAVDRHERAVYEVELARERRPRSAMMREVLDVAYERRKPPAKPITWSEAGVEGLGLEAARDFAGALALYDRVPDESEAVSRARARCYLALGNFTAALDVARRIPEAFGIRAEALVRLRRAAEALVEADAWLVATPDDARAHHVRGKSLFLLGRLDDARQAFNRACTLRPQLLEAMLLRREVERAQSGVRAAVGSEMPRELAIPEHLGELRDVLIGGRVAEGIELLRGATYERNPIARLLLGELLGFECRHAEALDVFDHVGDEPAALLGAATALLALDRPSEALERFERCTLDAALEGRSRALRALGRVAEAEAVFAQFVAATQRRAELRVGAMR